MNDIDTGSLGPSGRFARMEAALERIELKLDLKADLSRVTELEQRHVTLDNKLSGLIDGTIQPPRATEYVRRFEKMAESVDRLEDDESNRQAVLESAKRTADEKYIRLAWVVGLTTIANFVVNFIPIQAGP